MKASERLSQPYNEIKFLFGTGFKSTNPKKCSHAEEKFKSLL